MSGAPPASSREILSIQYLRAVAALMVAWHHAAGQVTGMSSLVPYIFGTSGVDLFFVISGFIMVATTAAAPAPVRPMEFWRRRIVRVVPLYWSLTVLMVAVALFTPGLFKTLRVEPGTLIQSLLFIPHYSHSFSDRVWPLLVPGWTLNFEMFFYAAFGASLFLTERNRLSALTMCFLALVLIGVVFGPFVSATAQTYTHPMLLEFVAGAWIGAGWTSGRIRFSFGLAVLMLGAGAALLVARDAPPFGPFTQLAGAALVVAGALHANFSRPRSAVLKAIGDSSYSLYLTHLFTLGAFRVLWTRLVPGAPLHAAEFMILSLIACAAVGWLTYRRVEAPLLRRLNGADRKRKGSPQVAAV